MRCLWLIVVQSLLLLCWVRVIGVENLHQHGLMTRRYGANRSVRNIGRRDKMIKTDSPSCWKMDEELYSRQLGIWGFEGQKKLGNSHVLVLGGLHDGVAIEVAKNLVLTGVGKLTIHETVRGRKCQNRDLGLSSFLVEQDVLQGRYLLDVLRSRLSELNAHASVRSTEGPLSEMRFEGYDAVVICGLSNAETREVENDCCSASNRFSKDIPAVIMANVRGAAGCLHVSVLSSRLHQREGELIDLSGTTGDQFLRRVFATGIDEADDGKKMISLCTKTDDHGIVEEKDGRHELQDGDSVELLFSVVGGHALRVLAKILDIKVSDPFSFSGQIKFEKRGFRWMPFGCLYDDCVYENIIRNSSNRTEVSHSLFMRKMRKGRIVVPRNSLAEDLDFHVSVGRDKVLHRCFLALEKFTEIFGRYPQPGCRVDAARFVKLSLEDGKDHLASDDDSKAAHLLTEIFSRTCRGSIPGVAAIIGGMATQEAIKVITKIGQPVRGFLYVNSAPELLLSLCNSGELNNLPSKKLTRDRGSRYDAQLNVWGSAFQNKLSKSRVFVVGAGAIGCEMLKLLGQLGIGTDQRGKITVADLDNVEKSNLARQILYRPTDLLKNKAKVAAEAVRRFNPNCRIQAYENRVDKRNEHIFDERHWSCLDAVANALDNVESRLYVDEKCAYHGLPLVDSGTHGLAGNTQVMLPFVSEAYGRSADPEIQQEIPVCSVKSFPYRIEHSIQWAIETYNQLFFDEPEKLQKYFDGDDYQAEEDDGRTRKIALAAFNFMLRNRYTNLENCVLWAKQTFDELLSISTLRLAQQEDIADKAAQLGVAPPKPPKLNLRDKFHMDFLRAAAALRASTLGLRKEAELLNAPENKSFYCVRRILRKSLHYRKADGSQLDGDAAKTKSLQDFTFSGTRFHKDLNDRNVRDFISSAALIRARSFHIPNLGSSDSVFRMAQRITPALATTTSVVAGMACLELCKLLNIECPRGPIMSDERKQSLLLRFHNGFVNLGLPFLTFVMPMASTKRELSGGVFSNTSVDEWSRLQLDFNRDVTLRHFLIYFKRRFGVDVQCIVTDDIEIYSGEKGEHQLQDHRDARIGTLLAEILGEKNFPKGEQKFVPLEVFGVDSNTKEDAVLPPVRYRFRHTASSRLRHIVRRLLFGRRPTV